MKKSILLLLTAFLYASCSIVPLTGRSQLAIFTTQDLMPLVKDEYKESLKESKVLTSTQEGQEIVKVGNKMAEAVELYLKEQGYKLSEVNDAIQALMSMDVKELSKVLDNPKATILELTIAKAMIQSLKKGSLYSMETLLTRVYGKPKETQQVSTDSRIEVVFVNGKTIL